MTPPPYLTLPAGWMPTVKQTPSPEATAQVQCKIPHLWFNFLNLGA